MRNWTSALRYTIVEVESIGHLQRQEHGFPGKSSGGEVLKVGREARTP